MVHRDHRRFDPATVAVRLRKFLSAPAPLAFVLGSGFQNLGTEFQAEAELSYADIPGFPSTSVRGHAGKWIAGRMHDVPVLVLSGRSHFYEGLPLSSVTFPIRVLAALGVRHLVLTNAAGGINPRFRPGDFMFLRDHINLLPDNPLRGPVAPGQTRFVDLSQVYDPDLNALLRQAAKAAKARVHGGVYLAVAGPNYETPAEIRAFARWGADAVGMSTVPEAIVARQCGMAVAGLSCITNLAAGRQRKPLSHAEVLATGERVRSVAAALLNHFVALYGENSASGTSSDSE